MFGKPNEATFSVGDLDLHLPVAAVRERSDDESACVAQVLEAVEYVGRDHAYCRVLLRPVVAQLADPLKVVRVTDARRHQVFHHVTGCVGS